MSAERTIETGTGQLLCVVRESVAIILISLVPAVIEILKHGKKKA